jgi:hypothetical protein
METEVPGPQQPRDISCVMEMAKKLGLELLLPGA